MKVYKKKLCIKLCSKSRIKSFIKSCIFNTIENTLFDMITRYYRVDSYRILFGKLPYPVESTGIDKSKWSYDDEYSSSINIIEYLSRQRLILMIRAYLFSRK